MAKEQKLTTGAVLAMVAILLLMRPNCQRGCRTVAEHLLEHGLEEFVAGLLS